MSSPGAGKTSLLERAIPRLERCLQVAVIEGDVCTTLDAERIARLSVKTVQINTQNACHLDARMVSNALHRFPQASIDLLFIENVGNLVCPADFDLGEHCRLTVISTPEGADKAEKYPSAFQSAHAVLLNKIDLLPYVAFDVGRFREVVSELNPAAPVFPMSAATGEGVADWTDWLLQMMKRERTVGSEKKFT
jgi:hydrogenase nickel incorporation protein HypB